MYTTFSVTAVYIHFKHSLKCILKFQKNDIRTNRKEHMLQLK